MINDMVFNESDLFSDYLELRESISQRIDDIDNFYEDNFGESNIMHFEKARIRLKKLLTFNPDIFELASNKNEMKSLYLMNSNKVQERNKNPARFSPLNLREDLNKTTFRPINDYTESDNFQSFYNAKGNNLVNQQEYIYQNNQNQSNFEDSNTRSKNNSPVRKQVEFNINRNMHNNVNSINKNQFQANIYSPINAAQNNTPLGYNNNMQGNFNYNYNVNGINQNIKNKYYNNNAPQNDVFGRLYPQSNRNLNNINGNSNNNPSRNIYPASKSPISRNKNDLANNNKTTNPNQSRVLSAPKINKNKAAKYSKKEVEYELDDFIGNKIPISYKKAGIPKNEFGGSFFDLDVDQREVMFRMKMSENEYQLFLRERNNAFKKK